MPPGAMHIEQGAASCIACTYRLLRASAHLRYATQHACLPQCLLTSLVQVPSTDDCIKQSQHGHLTRAWQPWQLQTQVANHLVHLVRPTAGYDLKDRGRERQPDTHKHVQHATLCGASDGRQRKAQGFTARLLEPGHGGCETMVSTVCTLGARYADCDCVTGYVTSGVMVPAHRGCCHQDPAASPPPRRQTKWIRNAAGWGPRRAGSGAATPFPACALQQQQQLHGIQDVSVITGSQHAGTTLKPFATPLLAHSHPLSQEPRLRAPQQRLDVLHPGCIRTCSLHHMALRPWPSPGRWCMNAGSTCDVPMRRGTCSVPAANVVGHSSVRLIMDSSLCSSFTLWQRQAWEQQPCTPTK